MAAELGLPECAIPSPPKFQRAGWMGPPHPGYGLHEVSSRTRQPIGTINFPREPPFLIFGRDPAAAHIFVGHPSVCGQHAVLAWDRDDQMCYVIDLESPSGTFVNDRVIPHTERNVLRPGDIVRFGHSAHSFIFDNIQDPNNSRPPPGPLLPPPRSPPPPLPPRFDDRGRPMSPRRHGPPSPRRGGAPSPRGRGPPSPRGRPPASPRTRPPPSPGRRGPPPSPGRRGPPPSPGRFGGPRFDDRRGPPMDDRGRPPPDRMDFEFNNPPRERFDDGRPPPRDRFGADDRMGPPSRQFDEPPPGRGMGPPPRRFEGRDFDERDHGRGPGRGRGQYDDRGFDDRGKGPPNDY